MIISIFLIDLFVNKVSEYWVPDGLVVMKL